jgi:hypothetical protein
LLDFVVQTDDGKWSIGWHDDAPGPFDTRAFAAAVAAQQTGGVKSSIADPETAAPGAAQRATPISCEPDGR